MATICGKITSGILIDCNNPITNGIDDLIYLYNKADISYTLSPTDSQVINGITMAAGTSGHAFQGVNNIFASLHKMVQIDAGPRYEHEIDFKILKNDAHTKAMLRNMAFGRFVAIVQNLSIGGDAQFELYGMAAGLILGENQRSSADENTAGSFVLKLTKPKALREPSLPATIQVLTASVYDPIATKAMILATIPAPIGTSTVVEV